MQTALAILGVLTVAGSARAQECPSGATVLSYQLTGHRVADEQLAFAGGTYLAIWENPEPTIAALAGDGTLGAVGPLPYQTNGAMTWRLTGGGSTFLLTSHMPDGMYVQLIGSGGAAIGAQRRVAAQTNMFSFAAAFDGARYDVLWIHQPDGAVYLVRVDEIGAVLDATPIRVATTTAGAHPFYPGGAVTSARVGSVTWVLFLEEDDSQLIQVAGVRVDDTGAVIDATPIALASFQFRGDGVLDGLAAASLGDQAMLALNRSGSDPHTLVLPIGPDGPLATSPTRIDPQPGAGLRVAAIRARPASDDYVLYLGTYAALFSAAPSPEPPPPGEFAGYAITRAGVLASTAPVLQASVASVSVASGSAGVALASIDEPMAGRSNLIVQRYDADGVRLGSTTVIADSYTLTPLCVCMIAQACGGGGGGGGGGGCAADGGRSGWLAVALALLVTAGVARSRTRRPGT